MITPVGGHTSRLNLSSDASIGYMCEQRDIFFSELDLASGNYASIIRRVNGNVSEPTKV